MTRRIGKSTTEDAAVAWLQPSGWHVAHGSEIAPDTPAGERADLDEVVLTQRLRNATCRFNPELPPEAIEDAYRKLTRLKGGDFVQRNRALHRLLVDGAPVEYRDATGAIRGAQAGVLDLHDSSYNDWQAVNQFAVNENMHARRPDMVLFLNCLPRAILELKNAANEDATIWSATSRSSRTKQRSHRCSRPTS